MEGVYWNMQCISPTTIIVPNIVRTVYVGMLKHLTDWITSFLKQQSTINICNQLWGMMPPYPGFGQFNKSYSQVMPSSGKEMTVLGWVIVPDFVVTQLNPSAIETICFTETLFYNKNWAYFHHMEQDWSHTAAKIKYMQNSLEDFHHHKDIFSQFGASKSTKKISKALKMLLTLDK